LRVTKENFAEQQETTETAWVQKLEEEKAKWREQAHSSPNFLQQPRADSSLVLIRKSTGLEMTGPSFDRPQSRRSSTVPIQPADYSTPLRQNSFPSLNHISSSSQIANGTSTSVIMGPPLVHSPEPDEYFMGSITPATPSAYGTQTNHSRGIHDIISVSTVGAGPSVQLVERMSATVRRLESERAASKDELSRLTAQRNQARQEVIEFMREVEEKRKLDNRVRELEAQVGQLDERYQTTLELLGEKSEQVEELQADIAELKKIYREVIDRTMK
jgi:TATA element modulatory factor